MEAPKGQPTDVIRFIPKNDGSQPSARSEHQYLETLASSRIRTPEEKDIYNYIHPNFRFHHWLQQSFLIISVYNYIDDILPSKMRENCVFFFAFSSVVKTKDSRTPSKHTISRFRSTCSSQHFFSFSILQCKCDSQNTGHPWVLVMWEWGWGFRSFFGNHIMKQTADRFASEIMSFFCGMLNHAGNLVMISTCLMLVSSQLFVPKSRNVGRQGPLIELLSTTSSIRQGGCHLGIVAWCLNKAQR